jgi:tartrate dehydratase alpha subunit/fumarate hydratase class I-like protein
MLQNTWTVIKVGINTNNRHTSSFHVQGMFSPCEAKAHALAKINADWSNQHSDYLRNCINRGDFTVSHTVGA